MTEIEQKANKKSLSYDTKYSEDRTLKDMLSRPQSFVEGAIEGIVNLLRQKAYRDGYIAGYTDAQNTITQFNRMALRGRIQWHDLRKNPEDLPHGYKVVLNQVGAATIYDPNRGFLGFNGTGVIAWCNVPIFAGGEK